MVSDELAQRMGKHYMIDPERLKKMLRDFTDEDVRKIGQATQPRSIWRLIDALAEGADQETNAHLRGWDTYEEQQADLRAVRELQEQMKAQTKGKGETNEQKQEHHNRPHQVRGGHQRDHEDQTLHIMVGHLRGHGGQ